jgi:hypothetical protein
LTSKTRETAIKTFSNELWLGFSGEVFLDGLLPPHESDGFGSSELGQLRQL